MRPRRLGRGAVLKGLFGRSSRTEPATEALYRSIVTQARQPAFYRNLGVPDSLDGVAASDISPPAGRPGAWEVLMAQTKVAERVPRSAPVYLRDLPRHPGNIHANTAGMLQAGRAFASVFLERFAEIE